MKGSDVYVNGENYVDGDAKPPGGFIGQQLLATNGSIWEWSGTTWIATGVLGAGKSADQGFGVPSEFTKMTSTTLSENIAKGQLHKTKVFPRIGNEHVESSREIQGTITSTNIVGQIFKASKDNISALMITLESAAGVTIDNFDGYANDAALQSAWTASGALATLETTIFLSSPNSMSIPTTNLADEWEAAAAPTDYTDYTGVFGAYFSHGFAQQQIQVFIGDSSGTRTKSFTLVQDGPDVWCNCEVNEKAMTEDGAWTTDVTDITRIGYRVLLKRVGGTVFIDDLQSVPPPGEIEIKLWDMGADIPVTAVNSIDDGTQYTTLGIAETASIALILQGGKRLYHLDEFTAGMNKSIPTNELLNINNYYILELNWVDTDVSVYGPDTSFTTNYYTNGYAFNAPDEATAITAIGQYSDIMFAILSTQDIYMVSSAWRFNAEPNGDSEISVFVEDNNMIVSDTVVDREHSPEQEFTFDLNLRPMFVEDGAKVEYYYNDDFTDSVSKINAEITYLYVPPVVNG